MKAQRASKFLATALEPLAASAWVLFVVWTLLVSVVWVFGWGEESVRAVIANNGLRSALIWLLGVLDPIWIILAAAHVYVSVVEEVGLQAARKWALLVVGTIGLITSVSAVSGFPLGSVRYTGRLGCRIGPIPCVLPLLWFVIVAGARDLVALLPRRFSATQLALGAGVIAVLTDLNLEPLAWKLRAFWIWYPARLHAPESVPWQNYLTWFLVVAALAFVLREPIVRRAGPQRSFRAILVLLLMNAVFLLTNLSAQRA